MVTRTVEKNETTGKHELIYSTRRTSLTHWLTIAAQLIAISVVVVAAVQFGVEQKVDDIITNELRRPDGKIYVAMEAHRTTCRVDEVIFPMQKNILECQILIKESRDDIKDIKEMLKNGYR